MQATDKLTFKNDTYECIGTVSHSGLDGMGHCIAHTKTDKGWYVCNDEYVAAASDQWRLGDLVAKYDRSARRCATEFAFRNLVGYVCLAMGVQKTPKNSAPVDAIKM